MASTKGKKNSPRKEVILEKAAHLFRKNGFNATSMRDLAENVGVEAASLYNHINSKAELLQEICFKIANKFTEHMDELMASDQTAIARIEAVLRFHIRQMIHNFEEVYVSDRDGNISLTPICRILKTNVASTASASLLLLKKA